MFHVKPANPGGVEGVSRGSDRGLAEARAGLTERKAPLWRACGSTALGLALLAACSSPDQAAGKTAPAEADQAATPAPSPPAPPTPAAEKVAFTDNAAEGEAKREFSYSWPAEVSAIPELAARLTADRDKLLAEQKAEWRSALKEFAGQDCAGCVNRDSSKSYELVANLPRFLSLSLAVYEYTGGAHGNPGTGALVWDREAKTALQPQDFFTSQRAMQDVLGTRWCKMLAAERRKRLGGEDGNDSMFPCPPVKDLTVLLGSKSKTHFDRIGLIADPYVAGSYAEGDYEVTLPVTQEILTAVKPGYRAYFARGE